MKGGLPMCRMEEAPTLHLPTRLFETLCPLKMVRIPSLDHPTLLTHLVSFQTLLAENLLRPWCKSPPLAPIVKVKTPLPTLCHSPHRKMETTDGMKRRVLERIKAKLLVSINNLLSLHLTNDELHWSVEKPFKEDNRASICLRTMSLERHLFF